MKASAPRSTKAGQHLEWPPRVSRERLEEISQFISPQHARQKWEIKAPFFNVRIGRVPVFTARDVIKTVQRARKAQVAWAQRSVKERARVLSKMHDLVLNAKEELMDLMQLESGKARLHALEEVLDVVNNCRYYAVHGPDMLKPRRCKGGIPLLTRATEYREPLGVVGIISPWNYPFTLALSDALPALLAGNSVVLKTSEKTPYSALRARELLIEAGMPPDVYQVVNGRGEVTGAMLIDHVNYVSFTGSTATGRLVGRQTGERLIRCSLELGGKNPMIICKDADLSRALEGAMRGFFTNAGQLCIAYERCYIHKEIWESFVSQLTRRTTEVRLGKSYDYGCDMGSLISPEHLKVVEKQVQDARKKGATVLTGGKARPDIGPSFYEPTLLTNVNKNMDIYYQETFGPVICLYPFENEEDAIRMANDSPYGLNASIWSANIRKAEDIAHKISAGTVNINDAYAAGWSSIDAHMGGIKDSGIGRRHGPEGLLKYTQTKNVAVQRFWNMQPGRRLGPRRFDRLVSTLLRLLKYLPGLR